MLREKALSKSQPPPALPETPSAREDEAPAAEQAAITNGAGPLMFSEG